MVSTMVASEERTIQASCSHLRYLQEWRLDVTLFVLLLAAFAAANALSLVSVTFVGLGMALGPRAQQVGLHAPTDAGAIL